MRMIDAKRWQRLFQDDSGLNVVLVSSMKDQGLPDIDLLISGDLKDGQGNSLRVNQSVHTEDQGNALKDIIKEFYSQYLPRDVEEGKIKTFSFEIQNNEMISWKQFSDFLAWSKIPYFVNPGKRLVTIGGEV